MLYDITLRISYKYSPPAAAGRHLLRLLPPEIEAAQRVRSARLDISPVPAERRGMVDFFGNLATHVVFREAHSRIAFALRAEVERLAGPASLDISPGLPRLAQEIAEYRSLDVEAPHHYLGASPRIRPMPDMTAYAREVTDGAGTVFEVTRALCNAIHRDFDYDPEATTVETPPEDAFARRRGVCQDFAQIMIAGLRGLGIPAGYVGGFLRTVPAPGKERLEGADAMHAWVQAWCGFEAGWIEVDPTNALVVGTDHVVVARGRDYGDVAPVAGILRTSGRQKSTHSVDVVAIEGAA